MDQAVAVLCAQLLTAAHWLSAELDAPVTTSADLVERTCRALRLVDELRPLTQQTCPAGDAWVHVDAVVSLARQLAVVLHQPGLAASEIRACVCLAIETLSLAARLGLSVARRRRSCCEICRQLAAAIVVWVLRWPAVLIVTALSHVDVLLTQRRRDSHVLLARGLGRAGPRRRRRLDWPTRARHQHRVSRRP
ncbi:MAG TPA: hypothetical protein VFX16_34655 [Pseudonocardiaceae bacterium]|nr:hypothetical protein [Pseudonocardiaceae bacterium]